jgi:hypothetical protein
VQQVVRRETERLELKTGKYSNDLVTLDRLLICRLPDSAYAILTISVIADPDPVENVSG